MAEDTIDAAQLKGLFKDNLIGSLLHINHVLNDKFEHLDTLDKHIKGLKENLLVVEEAVLQSEFKQQEQLAKAIFKMDELIRQYKVDMHKSSTDVTSSRDKRYIELNDKLTKLSLKVKNCYPETSKTKRKPKT